MSNKFEIIPVDINKTKPYWNEELWKYKLKYNNLKYQKIKIGQVEFFTIFSPAIGEPKARILFIHGFAEYHKLYEEFYEDLAERGYEVFFFDQRGAGLTSPGKFRGYTNNHYTIKDVDNMIEYNYNDKKDSIPLYLAGHSMGGGIILSYLISGKNKDMIKGGICTAPLVLLHPDTKPSYILEKLVILVCKFKGNILMNTKINPKFLTTDKVYSDFATNDTLLKPTGTIGQLRDFILRGRDLLQPEVYKNYDESKSLLILHSKDDHVNWSKGSKEFFDALNKEFPNSANSRKFISYDGLGHSLLVERNDKRAEIINEIVQFLDKDLKTLDITEE